MPGSVDLYSLIRREQKDREHIYDQEKQDDFKDRSDLLPLGFGRLKKHKAEYEHDRKHSCIIGQHTGDRPCEKVN